MRLTGGAGAPSDVRRLAGVVAAALVVLLSACGSDGGVQSWRGLELELPAGWEVYERRDNLLTAADAPLGEEPGDAGEREVIAQLTYDPSSSADDWRGLVTAEGGELEVDEQFQVDGVPATRLVWSWVTNGIPTREMVVLLPSRSLVMLFQPAPRADQTDAPEVFLEHREQFDAILESIDLGAPVEDG